MSSFRSQQLAARIRRVWLHDAATAERLPDPSLSAWARAQLQAVSAERHEHAADALPPDVSVTIDLFERTVDGAVRIGFGLQPGERLWGAYDADAGSLDRRGEHVHLVTELHPHGRHQMIDPCDLCGGGKGLDPERADDLAGRATGEAAGRRATDGARATPSADVPALEIGKELSSNYGELHLPFVISSRGYAVYISNAHMRGMLDLGQVHRDRWTFSAPAGPADAYVLGPGTPAELVQQFARLTGHQPLPPAWALGFIQSRFGYESFAHALRVLEHFEREQLAVHGLVFDVQWLREHVDLQWNPDGFEDPEQNLAQIARHGVRTVVITEPGTRRDASNFAPGVDRDAFAVGADGELYDSDQWYTRRGIEGYRPIEPGEGALVNFFREDAAEWWYSLHRHLLDDGVDAWWFDLNEPEDVTEDVRFAGTDWPVRRPELTGSEVRNVYALAQQRAFFHRDTAETDRRPFVLSRSGAAGSQRYGAAPWSGDVASTWADLRNQPRLGMTAGMCGIPLWGCDIGGFNGDPGAELFARWMQAGAFMPIYRAHGYMRDREPWSQGRKALDAIRPALTLRAQLLPSIVTWAREAIRAGLPLMRAMLLDHPDDERWHDCDDQWMFGPLLVAPVLEEGATSRTVQLPEGDWADLWSGEVHEGGGSIDVAAPLDTVPVFLPRTQALLVDPEPLAGRGRSWPPAALEVWTFAESASATLYVDDGITRRHEQGAYCDLRITIAAGAITLARLGGGWPAPPLRLVHAHPGVVAHPVA